MLDSFKGLQVEVIKYLCFSCFERVCTEVLMCFGFELCFDNRDVLNLLDMISWS